MMSNSTQHVFRLFFIAVACALFAGCGKSGPNTATVTGTITLDGKPTASIVIQFFPEAGGRPGLGSTNESGAYKIRFTQNSDGCIPGPNRIVMEAWSNPEVLASQFLPKRYNVEAQDNPEMLVDVKPGPNVFNFDISSQ